MMPGGQNTDRVTDDAKVDAVRKAFDKVEPDLVTQDRKARGISEDVFDGRVDCVEETAAQSGNARGVLTGRTDYLGLGFGMPGRVHGTARRAASMTSLCDRG